MGFSYTKDGLNRTHKSTVEAVCYAFDLEL